MALPLFLAFILIGFICVIKQRSTVLVFNKGSLSSYIISTLQACVLALNIGSISRQFFRAFPQKYSDLIIGGLGFANQNKSADLNSIYLFVFSFISIFILILISYHHHHENIDLYNHTIKISIYGLIPAFFMMGQSIRTPNSKYLMWFASSLIILSLITNLTLTFLNKRKIIQPQDALSTGIKLMLIPLFLGLSEIGIKMFVTRSGVSYYKFGIATVLFVVIYSSLIFFSHRSKRIFSRINLGVFIGQLGVPFLFFTLFTPPVKLVNGTTSLFDFKPALLIIIVGLILISLIDISIRFRREEKNDDSFLHLVSPWTLAAILVLLQSHLIQWPGIAADEYHWGEFYNPWWLLDQFNYLPFIDFQPARGLVNYIPGIFSWLFYDNSFAAQSLVFNQFTALYVLIAFFAFRPVVGDFIAFLMVGSLSSFTGEPSGGLIIAVASLAIMYKMVSKRIVLLAFWAWVGLSFFSSLLYVAEGSMFVLGTIPFAVWLLYKSYQQSRKYLLISLSMFSALAILLVLTTNIDNILLGVVRYLVEQAGVNEVAHGIAWELPSYDITQAVTSGYFWQIVRFSWILLIIPISAILMGKQFNRQNRENLFILIALLIISIILIPRAAGRIDPVAFSRPGLTSIGLVICGLPLVIQPNTRKSSPRVILPLFYALVFGLLGNQDAQLINAWGFPQQILQEPVNTVDGSTLGFSTLGTDILIDQNQLERQLDIKTVLDQLIGSDESFFDATNHSADYGIQGRPSPVTDLAPYNVPSSVQQKRIVEQLDANKVPVALIQAENILHDGGTLSLRNFIIYEYLLNNYYPFADDFGRIWMIRAGQEDRLYGTNYQIGNQTEQIELLTQSFWQLDLAGIPSSWGKSIEGLRNNLADPRNVLSESHVTEYEGLELLTDGSWKIVGLDSYLVFNLPEGLKGDLLYLEFNDKINGGNFQIYWTDYNDRNFDEKRSFKFSGSSDKYLIPVSTAPAWAKSDNIPYLRIAFPNGNSVDIHLEKVYFYSRK